NNTFGNAPRALAKKLKKCARTPTSCGVLTNGRRSDQSLQMCHTIRGADHCIGHGSHAERRQSHHALFPPVLWIAACNIDMAEHDIQGIKLPFEGSPVV